MDDGRQQLAVGGGGGVDDGGVTYDRREEGERVREGTPYPDKQVREWRGGGSKHRGDLFEDDRQLNKKKIGNPFCSCAATAAGGSWRSHF